MFLSFGIKDLIDILLVAMLLYYAYRLMKESRSLNIFFGVLIFIVFWLFVSQIREMRLLGTLLDRVVSVGAIALLILFQDEIRKFFSTIGTHQRVRAAVRFFRLVRISSTWEIKIGSRLPQMEIVRKPACLQPSSFTDGIRSGTKREPVTRTRRSLTAVKVQSLRSRCPLGPGRMVGLLFSYKVCAATEAGVHRRSGFSGSTQK